MVVPLRSTWLESVRPGAASDVGVYSPLRTVPCLKTDSEVGSFEDDPRGTAATAESGTGRFDGLSGLPLAVAEQQHPEIIDARRRVRQHDDRTPPAAIEPEERSIPTRPTIVPCDGPISRSREHPR